MHNYMHVESGTKRDESAFLSHDHEAREGKLIAVIREFVHELHPQRAKIMDVSATSRLERDLGIDSLGRTELILRIERSFRVRLAGATVGEAETVGDLLQALDQAHPGRAVPRVVAAIVDGCQGGRRNFLICKGEFPYRARIAPPRSGISAQERRRF